MPLNTLNTENRKLFSKIINPLKGDRRKKPSPKKKKTDRLLLFSLAGKTTTTVSRRYSQEFASSAPAPSKKHKRAAPIASGLRKNKPSYRKMITLALKHLGDAPRKGNTRRKNLINRKKNRTKDGIECVPLSLFLGHGLAEIRKWIESRYPVPDNSTRRIRLGTIIIMTNDDVITHPFRDSCSSRNCGERETHFAYWSRKVRRSEKFR